MSYSYDRTAAVLPLVIDEARVRRWVEHFRPQQKIRALVIFRGRSDTQIGVSANFEDGSNERFEVDLQFEWKSGRLEINPHFRGVR